MRIAVTGATGFLGRYVVDHLVGRGHSCRCWYRIGSDRGGFDRLREAIEWVPGSLRDKGSERALVAGCDAVVHAALDRPGPGFIGAEGELLPFVEANLLGSLRLFQAAREAGVGRFVFVSTCAVYEAILGRRLDRRNFRKKILSTGLLAALDRVRRGAHRPATLYRFRRRRPMTVEIV